MTVIKDSGDRTEFATGAVRDIQKGKGACNLMPLDVVAGIYADYSCELPVAKETIVAIFNLFEDFKEKGEVYCLYNILCSFVTGKAFGDMEWETMLLEVSKHFEAGAEKYGENNWQKGLPVKCYINSAVRHYLKWLRGDKDEPHDRAFVWNILCCIWTCKHKPELNDYAKKEGESDAAEL